MSNSEKNCLRKFLPSIIAGITLFTLPLYAQDKIDENALFADTAVVVDSAKVVNTKEATAAAEDKKAVSFSGEANAYLIPSLSRAWFSSPDGDSIGVASMIVGNALLDARIVGGIKAFADIQASYKPKTARAASLGDSGAQLSLREMFVDANYHKLVYLRAGKQVLQWGRCNLWTPTDLVNIDKKTFFQRIGHQEGTYGLKLHIPYKTLFNFYSFVNTNWDSTLTGLPVAVKAEALLGRTEFALSAWKHQGEKPVFGLDLSSQLFNIQIAAEASLRNGSDIGTLQQAPSTLFGWDHSTIGDKWFPRASVNLTKFLPLNGVADRVIVSGEFYYNHIGYDVNIFADPKLGPIIKLLMSGRVPDSLMQHLPFGSSGMSGLYEPNSYSKYYAALFTSVGRFILQDMTLSCNLIGNLNQQSYMATIGVGYQSMHNFTYSIFLNGFFGKENTEYTFAGSGLQVQASMGLQF
jgi:hypothetical protein